MLKQIRLVILFCLWSCLWLCLWPAILPAEGISETVHTFVVSHTITVGTPANPELITQVNWAQEYGQDVCETAFGAASTVNPTFSGVWAGDPLLPPNWNNLTMDAGEDVHQETVDLPTSFTVGGYFNVDAVGEGITQQQVAITTSQYSFITCWVKVAAGTAMIFHRTTSNYNIISTAAATWSRLRSVSIAPANGTYSSRLVASGGAATFRATNFRSGLTPGLRAELIKADGTIYNGRLYWVTTSGGNVQLNIGTVDAAAAGQVIVKIKVYENARRISGRRRID